MLYSFGPFRLDSDKRRLWRGDEPVPLTPKAFDTLEVLVARAGQVVDKDDLLKAVWPDTFVEEGTLAQNISTLRKVLGDTAERPTYIATVPRRGYRFLETVSTGVPRPPDTLTAPAEGQAPTVAVDVPPATTHPPSAAGTSQPLSHRWRYARITLAIVGAVGIVGFLTSYRPPARHVVAPVRFTITAPEGTTFSTSGSFMTVSPDGRYLAFVASGSDRQDRLWIRRIDAVSAVAIPGTEGAWQPFWAADSRYIAFFSNDKLKKVGVSGEPVQTIGDTPAGFTPLAGTWNRQGDILFPVANGRHLYHVASTGGAVKRVMLAGHDDAGLPGWPQFLPDDRHFLYLLRNAPPEQAGLYVGSLDGRPPTRVAAVDSYAMYVAPGYLLFVDRGTLWRQPFDVETWRLSGERAPIAEDIVFNPGTARATFSASQTGVLAYRRIDETRLTWFDRAGRESGTVGTPGIHPAFAISPDGANVAVARVEPGSGTSDIWIFPAHGGDGRQLTFVRSWNLGPVWSQDGTRVVFTSNRSGRWAVYQKDVSGSAPEQLLLGATASRDSHPQDWADDRLLLHIFDERGRGFWLFSPARDQRLTRLAHVEGSDGGGRISPDGRWLAYVSAKSGAASVFVAPVGSSAGQWAISPNGGTEPTWRRDRGELFYLARDLSLMAVNVKIDRSFEAGPPRLLFRTNAVAPTAAVGRAYDVSPDGQRFLVKVPASLSAITVVVHWTELFRDGWPN